MKINMKLTLVFTAIVVTASSFLIEDLRPKKPSAAAATKFGQELLDALQKNSEEKYLAMLPSVDELKAIMKKNEALYGSNLENAQSEIAKNYVTETIPSAKENFAKVLKVAEEKGIDWKNVGFIKAEASQQSETPAVNVYFYSGKNLFLLTVERVLELDGQVKATQFISLQ
jgi:hypothetical protein